MTSTVKRGIQKWWATSVIVTKLLKVNSYPTGEKFIPSGHPDRSQKKVNWPTSSVLTKELESSKAEWPRVLKFLAKTFFFNL
jgi:hypothetical protein